jgi:hypothetical protein
LRTLAREERVDLSPTGGETEVVVVVVLLAKGFENRRGIVSVWYEDLQNAAAQ